ncbi:MAG TPA: ribonuclease J [Polyangia bacterium]|nr:ribonuclease J [Polyangia bacterium]
MRVVPLGGCGEFGRNLTVYEADGALLCVDCGGQIPDEESPGVDMWMPDFTWLASRGGDVVGWVLTHAHEDHIAALPHALAVAPAPIYGRPLTLARLRGAIDQSQLHVLEPGATIALGPFTIESLTVAHSIPDACAISINAGGRRVIHTGDLKIDPDAVTPTDIARLRALGQDATGVDLLVADSTNATRPGRSGSETDVARALVAQLEAARGRVVFSFFSSSVQRIATIMSACQRLGRKVCLEGRGLKEMTQAAISVGALNPPAGLLIDAASVMTRPPSSVALLVTGSQGEARAALGRMAYGEHPLISLGRNDTLVLSSRPVPGNERAVARIVDKLLARGVRLVDAPGLHASGHACQDELRELMQLTEPRALMPVHGGRRQLFAHADLAESVGVPSFVLVDGDILELTESGARLLEERVPTGRVSLEGTQLGDVDHEVLRARRRMAGDGVVFVAEVAGKLRVEAHGVANATTLPAIVADAEAAAEAARRDPGGVDVPTAVRRAVQRTFMRARGRKPRVIALV